MKALVILSCVSVAFFFTSCATIISGRTAKVKLKSESVSTLVTLKYDNKVESVYLPHTIKVKRGNKPTLLEASAPGYNDAHVTIYKKFNPTTLWNILAGGFIGIGVDAATGTLMKPQKKEYEIPLYKAYTTPTTPTNLLQVPMPSKETFLLKDGITCVFESDPQDARIFWRVISSVPEEVENTNELWLGNTPFKETRSFNINGLTKDNAQNVQIEIKVKRKGYADQTKRFNVRQVMEQKEISNFFDMVKE